ncbi:MAG: hypothetical protein WC683_05805 [bacterium]
MAIGRKHAVDNPQEKRIGLWQLDCLFPSNTKPTVASNPETYGRMTGSLEGRCGIDASTGLFYYYYNSAWRTLSGSGGGGVGSIDQVLAAGATADDIGAPFAITEATTNTALFNLTKTQTGNADMVNFDNYGTGDTLVTKDGGVEMIAFEDGGKVQFSASLTDTIAIDIPDGKEIAFGSSDDFLVEYVGATDFLTFTPRADSVTIAFGVDGTGPDFKVFGATAGAYSLWDASAALQLMEGGASDIAHLKLNDADTIELGDGASATGEAGDFSITFDGTNLLINPVADDTGAIYIGTDSTLACDFKWFSKTASDYVLLDAGNDVMAFEDVDIIAKDGTYVYFGDGSATAGDAGIVWDGTDLKIQPTTTDTGILRLGKKATDDLTWDVRWDGNTDAYLLLDAGNETALFSGFASVVVADDVKLGLGTSAAAPDAYFEWDTASTEQLLLTNKNASSPFKIGADTTHVFDLIWTGGAGTLNIDASGDFMYLEAFDLKLNDSDVLNLGDGASATAVTGDAQLQYASETLALTKGAGGAMTTFNLGANEAGFDMKWFGTTDGYYVLFDAVLNNQLEIGVPVWVKDDFALKFGNSDDVTMAWLASGGFYVIPAAANTEWYFGNGEGLDYDVIFPGVGAGSSMKWDTSLATLFLEGGGADTSYVKLNDNDKLGLGDGASATASVGDVEIYHDGTYLQVSKGSGGTLTSVKVNVPEVITMDDGTNTGVTDLLQLVHSTSGAPGAGIGAGISVIVENDTDATTEVASIDFVNTNDGTKASLDTDIVFSTMLNGAATEVLRIDAANEQITVGKNATDADNVDKIKIWPQTASKGALILQSVANTDDVTVTIQNAAHATAGRAYTFGDAGANKYVAYTAQANGTIARSDLTEEALASHPVPVYTLRAADGAALGLADTGDSGDHYLTYSAGVWALMGNSPDSDTQTDVSLFQFALPPNYVAAGDVKIRVNSLFTADGDTKTVDLNVYEINKTDGTKGADICETTVITLTGTAAAHDFTVTAADLVAGDLLSVIVTTAFQDADGAVGEAKINSIEVLCDVKG